MLRHAIEARVLRENEVIRFCAILSLILVFMAQALAQPVSNDPRLQRVEVEEPGRTGIRAVYRVTISEPLEESDLKAISRELSAQVRHTDAVGIRFVLPHTKQEERDPEAGRAFYAWRLIITGDKVDIFNMMGVSRVQAAKQVAAFNPASADKVRGIWIDNSNPLGLVAIIDRAGGIYFLHLADPETRYLMRKAQSARTGTWLEAVHSETRGQQFKADGHGTDRLGVHLALDGTLRIHGGRYQLAAKPWLIAIPHRP